MLENPALKQKAEAEGLPKYVNTTSSNIRILDFSLNQKKKLDENALYEAINDPALVKPGSDAVSTLQEILRQRYGNCVRAWRKILDPAGRGVVSYSDFSAALQDLCFKCSAKETWKALAGHANIDEKIMAGKCFIKLKNLDETSDGIIRSYQNLMVHMCEKKEKPTLKALCESKESLRIDRHTFRESCKVLKNLKKPGQLFDLLQLGDGYLTLEDAEWLENHCKPPPEPIDHMALQIEQKSSRGHQLRLQAVNDRQKQVKDAKEPWQQDKEREPKRPQVDELRRLLCKKWGSCARAWWQEFDPDQLELLPEADFLNSLENVPYMGDTSILMEQLKKEEEDIVTIDHIDPRILKALENFKQCCIIRDGSIENAFRQCHVKGKPIVERNEFTFWCREVGLEEKNNHWLLADYLDRLNVGAFSLEWIDNKTAVKVFGRKPLDDVQEELKQREQLVRPSPRKSLVARQKTPHRLSIQPDLNLEDLKPVRGRQAFLDMLEAKFGSVIRAWRRVLDCNGDGKLSREEFYSGVRAVGYAGNVENLWLDFETDLTGNLTLDDMHPESKQECIDFHDLCEETYGSLAEAFDHGDKDGNGEIKFMEFCKLCRDIGFRGDMNKMFAHLDVDGSGQVAFEEMQFLELVKHGCISDLLAQEFEKRKEEKALLRGKDRNHPDAVVMQQNRNIRLARERMQRRKEIKAIKGEFIACMSDSHKIRSGKGWHLLLDPNHKGVLRRPDLNKAAEAIKFKGDVDALWKRLDPEGNGEVEAKKLFPDAHKELVQFQQCLCNFYGSLDDAFQRVDKDGSLRLDIEGFREWCRQVEFRGNEKRLFHYLDTVGAGQISLANIDEDTFEELFEDAPLDDVSGKVRKLPGWEDIVGQQMEQLKSERNVKKVEEIRVNERKEFQHVLIRRHGTLVGGWKALAGTSKATMKFKDFKGMLDKMKFQGDHKLLWRSLLGDGVEQKQTLSIHDVEPEIASDIKAFKKCLKERYGNLDDGLDYIDLHHTGILSLKDFLYVCRECEFRGNERRLFEYMDTNNMGQIILEDIDKKATDSMVEKRAKMMAINGYGAAQRRLLQEAFPHTVPPVGESGGEPALRNFLHFLEQKHGTVFKAWRRALDFDEKGLLNFVEFRKGCYALGFGGNVRNVWAWLESVGAVDEDGFISLKALDKKAFDVLEKFRKCCVSRLGSVKNVFADNRGKVSVRVERKQFQDLCKFIKLPTDWETIYGMLDPPGVGSLTWADLRFVEGWGQRSGFGKRRHERQMASPAKGRIKEGPLNSHITARIVTLPALKKSQSLPDLKSSSKSLKSSSKSLKSEGSPSSSGLKKSQTTASTAASTSPLQQPLQQPASPFRNTWNHRHHINDTIENKPTQLLFELNYVDQTTQAAFQRKVHAKSKGQTLQEFVQAVQDGRTDDEAWY